MLRLGLMTRLNVSIASAIAYMTADFDVGCLPPPYSLGLVPLYAKMSMCCGSL